MSSFWRSWPSYATAALSGVAAFGLSSGAGSDHGSARVGLYLGAGVATLLAAGITTNNQRLESKQTGVAQEAVAAAELRLRLALGDSLGPIVQLMARLHSTRSGRSKEQLRGEALTAVLGAATQLVGGARVRACYFDLIAADGSGPRRLQPRIHVGRSGEPQSIFAAGTERGDAALAMVDRHGRHFCRDVQREPPPGWTGSQNGYQTFVSIAVVAGDDPFGMVTVDALEPGDLDDEEEVGLLDLLAGLLAAVLSA